MPKRSGYFCALASLVLLWASGCGRPATGINPDPAKLDFGQVWVGSRSLDQDARWTNDGGPTLSIYLAPGQVPPPFKNGFGGPSAASFADQPVTPGASTPLIAVCFIPAQAGPADADLAPSSLGGQSAAPLKLHGEGITRLERGSIHFRGGYIAALAQGPSGQVVSSFGQPNDGPLDFGDIVVGGRSSKTIEISNSGNSDLGMTVLWPGWMAGLFKYSGNYFSAEESTGNAGLSSFTVPAGGSVTVVITYKPQEVGVHTAIFEVTDGTVTWNGPPNRPAAVNVANASNSAQISVIGRAHALN
jgi:hypothetical protein